MKTMEFGLHFTKNYTIVFFYILPFSEIYTFLFEICNGCFIIFKYHINDYRIVELSEFTRFNTMITFIKHMQTNLETVHQYATFVTMK